METATAVLERTEIKPQDDIVHSTWCCDENRLLCGTPDAENMEWADDAEETDCVVCADLETLDQCPGCGENW